VPVTTLPSTRSTLLPYTTLFRSQHPAQAPVDERQRQRAGGAHRATLGRRRDAEEDGSQHQEDERERRDQHEEHTGDKLPGAGNRSEEHTSELQSRVDLVCRLLLE